MAKEHQIDEYQVYYSSSQASIRKISLREDGKYVADLIFFLASVTLPPDTDSKPDGTRLKLYFRPNDFDPILEILALVKSYATLTPRAAKRTMESGQRYSRSIKELRSWA